jgi:ketosteroid isomerase-like protein
VTDRAHVERWLADYVAAWKSYDREAIGALFSEDAECRYHPYDDPIVGRAAIVESWFGVGEGAPGKDPEGTFEGVYESVAIDGDLAVVTGVSTYSSEPGGPVTEAYDNCWLVRFDSDGLCRDFVEWFMKRP